MAHTTETHDINPAGNMSIRAEASSNASHGDARSIEFLWRPLFLSIVCLCRVKCKTSYANVGGLPIFGVSPYVKSHMKNAETNLYAIIH